MNMMGIFIICKTKFPGDDGDTLLLASPTGTLVLNRKIYPDTFVNTFVYVTIVFLYITSDRRQFIPVM